MHADHEKGPASPFTSVVVSIVLPEIISFKCIVLDAALWLTIIRHDNDDDNDDNEPDEQR
jgi:hypothetical protein